MALNHIVNDVPVEVKHINYGTGVGYTVVGSPTIVKGILSTTSYSDHLNFSSSVMLRSNNFEIGTKVILTSISTGQRIICNSGGANVFSGLHFASSGRHLDFYFYDTVSQQQYRVISSVTAVVNTPYYVKVYRQGTMLGISVSEDKQNWTTDTLAIPETANMASGSSYPWHIGAASQSYLRGSLDLNETYIKIDGKLWFYRPTTNYLVKDNKLVFADSGLYIEESGVKTYATADLAPVPSGYTYATTTTPSIGWVDMRTQQFTAAPAGAVLGKDEVI